MQLKEAKKSGSSAFEAELKEKKALIDAAIDEFVESFEHETGECFGNYPLETIKTFTSYLSRGGKHIRGILTIVAYEMCGGKDIKMIVEAALAIEMLQTYLLMLDDIQDRSTTRRGGPTAHEMLADFHQLHHFKDESKHFGHSMTINAAMIGCHVALNKIANLSVDKTFLVKALNNVHQCYITTGYGQILDVFNEVAGKVDEQSIENVLIWKTAYYTFVNPLQFGAILAGASNDDLKVIQEYSIPAGRLFQITDDIIGVFGDEAKSGKSPLDDIKEGKMTLLTAKAIELAPKADAYFLEQCLGKQDLNITEFQRCQEIIITTGALDFAKKSAITSSENAKKVLEHAPNSWEKSKINFLDDLIGFILERNS